MHISAFAVFAVLVSGLILYGVVHLLRESALEHGWWLVAAATFVVLLVLHFLLAHGVNHAVTHLSQH